MACSFGGAINDYFGWNVDMKNFDMEVIINIDYAEVYVCLALTRVTMHKRFITHFGLTTLKGTIAYNMLT